MISFSARNITALPRDGLLLAWVELITDNKLSLLSDSNQVERFVPALTFCAQQRTDSLFALRAILPSASAHTKRHLSGEQFHRCATDDRSHTRDISSGRQRCVWLAHYVRAST